MTAGVPNYQRLMELGKLPEGSRKNIPLLAELDAAEERLELIKAGLCAGCREKLFKELADEPVEDSAPAFEVKCEAEGCVYVGKGKSERGAKNMIRLHSKTHVVKN